MKDHFIFLFLFSCYISTAQDKIQNTAVKDSVLRNKSIQDAQNKDILRKADENTVKITDYKIISYQRDTSYFDTTLTIQKEYRYNYLRSDDFELLPFANLGQTYNTLAHQFNNNTIYPEMGMRAKHFNYMETKAINYYHVPTPVTELFFKTAMEQGQLLDAFITLNTSPQFNFSMAYKGLRSLGKYQHIRSSTGNFRFTMNYQSKNKKYRLRGHLVAQDLLNQENGGIEDEADFESGNPQFTDRSRITVNFENAENLLDGKRYFLEQEYSLLQQHDSIAKYSLDLGYRVNYETKFYHFDQTSPYDSLGDAFRISGFRDKARLRTLQNQLYLSYTTKTLGALAFKTLHYHYNYFFKSIIYTDEGAIITNQLRNSELALGGSWKHNIGNLALSADLMINVSGPLGGTLFNGHAKYQIDNDKTLEAGISISERAPNFNFLLYHSNYIAYNWQNTETFNKKRTQQLRFGFLSEKWLTAGVALSVLDNHTYFATAPAETNAQVQPFQYTNTINYLNVKLEKEFKFGNFALNNTLMYQNVIQDDAVINVPEFVTRNTLYYSSHLFKKAMYVQTGITFKYFTAYNANAYSPLLGEFYVQNQQEIGNFPLLDFFINAKVQQTRIYVKAEHFNSAFTGYNFYSAPNYPYRDFIVRFGLVWDFFL